VQQHGHFDKLNDRKYFPKMSHDALSWIGFAELKIASAVASQ
jgi:hypothetical protein